MPFWLPWNFSIRRSKMIVTLSGLHFVSSWDINEVAISRYNVAREAQT